MNDLERRLQKRFDNIARGGTIGLFICIIGAFFASFMILSDGFQKRELYNTLKDSAVPVSATVTEISHYESDYYVYVSYNYDGEEFTDIFWKKSDIEYKVGETVEIKILREIPRDIFSDDDGTSDFIMATILFVPSTAVITVAIVHFMKKRKQKITAVS